jgi:GntR family transcriptional regulator
MNYIVLNKFSKIPLYLQLKDSIKKAINDGILKNKEQLPTEESLCKVFNVSRPVVRQAYNELIDEGLVLRHQGKGTFVHKATIYTNLMYRMHYREELQKRGVIAETRLLVLDVIDRTELPDSAHFQDKYQSFFLIKRLRTGDKVPLLYDNSYFPTTLFPGIGHGDYCIDSYHEYIKQIYPLDELRTETSFTSTVLDEESSAILDVDIGSAAFKFTNYYKDIEGNLVYMRIAYFPGERHQIQIITEEQDEQY